MKQIHRDTRKFHFCPFPSCQRAVKKLSQHLQYKHPDLSSTDRKSICQKAKVAAFKGARKSQPPAPQQSSILSFTKSPDQTSRPLDKSVSPEPSADVVPSAAKLKNIDHASHNLDESTNDGMDADQEEKPDGDSPEMGNESDMQEVEEKESESQDLKNMDESVQEESLSKWPAFPSEEPFLVKLREHLTSRHGRSRSENESKQVSVETSRYLYFAQPEKLQETLLLDITILDRYFRALEKSGVVSSTLVAKLSRLNVAIEFVSLSLDPDKLAYVEKVKSVLKNWRSVLGREVRQANQERLEDMSENPVGFEDSQAFLSCPELRSLTLDIIAQAKRKQPVKGPDLRSAVLWLAGSLLLANHQRPGAVVNATTDEYTSAKITTFGRDQYKTFYVRQHKTGTTGRAKITANKNLFTMLDEYMTHLRPLLGESVLLFPNREGKPLDHLSRHVAKLGAKFGIKVPTATESRRAAATAISKGDEKEREAVASMMSHSVQTQQRYVG